MQLLNFSTFTIFYMHKLQIHYPIIHFYTAGAQVANYCGKYIHSKLASDPAFCKLELLEFYWNNIRHTLIVSTHYPSIFLVILNNTIII